MLFLSTKFFVGVILIKQLIKYKSRLPDRSPVPGKLPAVMIFLPEPELRRAPH
jgi:hypothetical protein